MTVSLASADGRVLVEQVVGCRPVPHYRRAAKDGFAVRAADTFDATDRSPARLRVSDDVGRGTATRVHTGSALPDAADAVVMVEHVETVGEKLEVFDAVAQGENVAPVCEDVSAGAELFERGHRMDPADLCLAKSVGRDTVTVYERPDIAVIPTGEELVQTDSDPGEVVGTNGLTSSRYVDRWGGIARYGDVVPDDWEPLQTTIEIYSPLTSTP